MSSEQRGRVKVACCNWSHPDAPHAIAYVVDEDGSALADRFFATFAEAVAYGDRLTAFARGRWPNRRPDPRGTS